jgi:hypothetical protein
MHIYRWEKIVNEKGFAMTKCLEKQDTVFSIVARFHEALEKYAYHRYSFCRQYREIRQVKEALRTGDIAVHVDFSENYVCKSSSEVQASHFGHHDTITIHQGVLYKASQPPMAFATVSEDSRKSASAVAVHIEAILKEFICSENRRLIIFSDSPTSQYRNKKTILLINHLTEKYKFDSFEWLFTEKGHGKSCADGVGAAIKRMADERVALGESIQGCEDLLQLVSDANIFMKKVRISTIYKLTQQGSKRRTTVFSF